MTYLEVKVIEVSRHCPVYGQSDSFVLLEGYKLTAEKPICMHLLVSVMP